MPGTGLSTYMNTSQKQVVHLTEEGKQGTLTCPRPLVAEPSNLAPEPMLLTLTVTKMEHAGNSQIWR